MTEIGVHQAKTHLSRLLSRVAQGERFVITHHGKPVAELIPIAGRSTDQIRSAIDSLKDFQATHTLGDLSVQDLIEKERRY